MSGIAFFLDRRFTLLFDAKEWLLPSYNTLLLSSISRITISFILKCFSVWVRDCLAFSSEYSFPCDVWYCLLLWNTGLPFSLMQRMTLLFDEINGSVRSKIVMLPGVMNGLSLWRNWLLLPCDRMIDLLRRYGCLFSLTLIGIFVLCNVSISWRCKGLKFSLKNQRRFFLIGSFSYFTPHDLISGDLCFFGTFVTITQSIIFFSATLDHTTPISSDTPVFFAWELLPLLSNFCATPSSPPAPCPKACAGLLTRLHAHTGIQVVPSAHPQSGPRTFHLSESEVSRCNHTKNHTNRS